MDVKQEALFWVLLAQKFPETGGEQVPHVVLLRDSNTRSVGTSQSGNLTMLQSHTARCGGGDVTGRRNAKGSHGFHRLNQ